MAQVEILVSGFAGSYANLNKNHVIDISNVDIARGLVTIGKIHWLEYFRHPIEVLNDFTHQLTGLNTFISHSNDKLCISHRFKQLDASEKRIKSYNIGMGIAKIVADRLLNVPHVQHLDFLVEQGIAKITKGSKERGDLVGIDLNGNWHVIEAKGSSYPFNQSDIDHAKNQAQRVQTINRINPDTKNCCCTSFNELMTTVNFIDPDDNTKEPMDIDIDKVKFIKSFSTIL